MINELEMINTAGGRSKECIKIMYQLSFLVASLDLDKEIHDKFMEFLMQLITTAERDAFIYGVNLAQGIMPEKKIELREL